MRKDALQRDLPTPDEACARYHCLQQGVEAPDLATVKDFFAFEQQFNQWFHCPMVFLNDQPWDRSFVNALTEVASGEVQFEMISEEMWGFPDWMDQDEARREMKKQAGHGIMYGGAESYHHMCRFYSGWVP